MCSSHISAMGMTDMMAGEEETRKARRSTARGKVKAEKRRGKEVKRGVAGGWGVGV